MLSKLRINENYKLVYGKTKVMAANNEITVDRNWPPAENFKNTEIATEDIHSGIKPYTKPEYNSMDMDESKFIS